MESNQEHLMGEAPSGPSQEGPFFDQETVSIPVPWHFLDVLLMTLGIVMIMGVFFFAVQFFARDFPALTDLSKPSILLSVLLGALEGVALLGSVWLFGLLRRRLNWRDVGLRHTKSTWIILSIGIGLAAIPASMLLSYIIQSVSGLPADNPQLDFIAPEGFSWSGMILMTLFGGIVAPLAEEVFFRGVLFAWFRKHWGFWLSAIVSSLIFGTIHLEITIVVMGSLLGIVLAWMYERSGSLWCSVIIHAIYNSLQIILLYAVLAFT